MKKLLVLLLIFGFTKSSIAQSAANTISSPDKNILVSCDVANASYTIAYKGGIVLKNSKLGVAREDEDFSKNLQLVKVTAPVIVKDNYAMLNAKKKNISYTATQRIFETKTSSGKKMNIIFRVSNDGVAFNMNFRKDQPT